MPFSIPTERRSVNSIPIFDFNRGINGISMWASAIQQAGTGYDEATSGIPSRLTRCMRRLQKLNFSQRQALSVRPGDGRLEQEVIMIYRTGRAPSTISWHS